MKIYPSKHKIIQTNTINLKTDIPLAFVDTESKEYDLNIIESLKAGDVSPVLPYTEFDSYEVALFKPNSSSNLNDSDYFTKIDHSKIIQRVGNKYQYVPLNSVTFFPETFNYQVIVKKNLSYIMQQTYNLKIGCIDNINSDYLSKKLIKLFGDAPSRGICPNNIWVNNKDISIYSLMNSSLEELDFLFMTSKNGNVYTKYNEISKTYEEVSTFNKEFLSKQTNVWLSVDNFPLELKDNVSTFSYPTLYSVATSNSSTFSNSGVTKNLFKVDGEDDEEIVLHTIFKNNSCAVIKEYKNKGFMIYTPKDFFMNLENNISIFYEILFFIYSRSYLKSNSVNQWITDQIPDYVVTNNKLTTIDKFLSNKQIYNMFNLNINDVIFSKIEIDKENILMTGLYNEYIVFKKEYTDNYIKYADPQKTDANMISIYTPQRQIMYFDEFIYSIEDNVNSRLKYERVNNNFVINLRGFKNTYNNICIENDPTNNLTIPLTRTINYQQIPIDNTLFYICSKENILSCYDVNSYIEEYGTIIAKINIAKTDNDPKIYDMRRRGGGLPENSEDDYNLLDIGHIFGKAYRKSGAIVITLPGRLDPYKNIIEKVIRKHIVAEKYPVILFEKETEGGQD